MLIMECWDLDVDRVLDGDRRVTAFTPPIAVQGLGIEDLAPAIDATVFRLGLLAQRKRAQPGILR